MFALPKASSFRVQLIKYRDKRISPGILNLTSFCTCVNLGHEGRTLCSKEHFWKYSGPRNIWKTGKVGAKLSLTLFILPQGTDFRHLFLTTGWTKTSNDKWLSTTPEGCMEECRRNSTHSSFRNKTEVSDQVHAPATLSRGKRHRRPGRRVIPSAACAGEFSNSNNNSNAPGGGRSLFITRWFDASLQHTTIERHLPEKNEKLLIGFANYTLLQGTFCDEIQASEPPFEAHLPIMRQ
jgi:hypothetical protein